MTTEIIRDKVEFISDRDLGSNRQTYFQIVNTYTYNKCINFSIQDSRLIKINVDLDTNSDDFDSF